MITHAYLAFQNSNKFSGYLQCLFQYFFYLHLHKQQFYLDNHFVIQIVFTVVMNEYLFLPLQYLFKCKEYLTCLVPFFFTLRLCSI
jgi:hypothetical protein